MFVEAESCEVHEYLLRGMLGNEARAKAIDILCENILLKADGALCLVCGHPRGEDLSKRRLRGGLRLAQLNCQGREEVAKLMPLPGWRYTIER